MDMVSLLEEAKTQLHEEADYEQEARYLKAFVRALGDDERFLIPRPIPHLSAARILGMTYVPGIPIEEVAHETAAERSRVLGLLFELLMIELFQLRLVQTDPNFANYRYHTTTGQVALLDFGASRRFKVGLIRSYRELLVAAIDADRSAMIRAAESIGYDLGPEGSVYRETLLDLAELVLVPLTHNQPYDFGRSDIPQEVLKRVEVLKSGRAFWQIPPMDVAYIHRKIGGLFMLATRLKAEVNVHELLMPWLK